MIERLTIKRKGVVSMPDKKNISMTKKEVLIFVSQLKSVFDIVRLVDVSRNTQVLITDRGEMKEEAYHCYAIWNKDKRCENCISAKAFAQKGKATKFEFIGNDAYYIVSMYVEVDDFPYMLEMVSQVNDETLFGAYGKDKFAETITAYNQKLYIDSMTGVYNRRYYEEQLLGLKNEKAVAMLDVDDFKNINDTYGHLVGDMALQAIADVILSCVSDTDAVVRYGGDEFLLVFGEISQKVFVEKLEEIRQKVSAIRLKDYPVLHFSVSIGGEYGIREEEHIIQKADDMLYEAKIEKNKVKVDKCR